MTVPEILYKYKNISSESGQRFTRSLLVDGALYFASPEELNDPFEIHFLLSLGDKPESELTASQRYAINNLAYHMRKSMGILSLTAKCDDILMWSHYADSHKGICIGFTTSGESDFFQFAQPVIYSSSLLTLTPSTKNKRELAELTKYKQWEYEEEWRIIDRKGPGVRSFPQSHIASIILGSSISDQNRNLVFEWVGQMKHTVSVFETRLNQQSYKVEIHSVAA